MTTFINSSVTVQFILEKAAKEAMAFNLNCLDTEYVLWALLLDKKIQMLLSDLGVCPENAKSAVLSISTCEEERPFSLRSIFQSPKVIEALRLAQDEANEDSAREIHQGYLLVGLLLGAEDSATTILKSLNITVEMMREYLACHPVWHFPTEKVQEMKRGIGAELAGIQERKRRVCLKLESARIAVGEIPKLEQEEADFETRLRRLEEEEKIVSTHLARVE